MAIMRRDGGGAGTAGKVTAAPRNKGKISTAPAAKPVMPQAPPAQPARIPMPQMGGGTAPAPRSGTGYGGGGVGTLSTGVISEVAPAPQMDFNSYAQQGLAAKDAAFVAEDASAQAELDALLAQLARQNSEYETGFKGSLKSLGLDWEGDNWKGGQWDAQDTLGAYGQSYQNLQNDYSGRGLMDSTFYGNAQRDLTDRFDRQRDEAIKGLDQQRGSYEMSTTQAQKAREQAKQRALTEAYARYVSGFSI